MKKYLFLLCVCTSFLLQSQNPFEKFGYEPKISTLSQGKYNEFFDQDTIVQIGQAVFNTKTKKLIGFIEQDTMYSEATLEPEVVSRWLSPDPLASEAPNWTPYRYAFNNPVAFFDPDGRYEVSASFQKQYPVFSQYLKNFVANDVMNSPVILEAFKRNSSADSPNGIGNLNDAEVLKAVTWGSGPQIISREDPGGMTGASGYYDSRETQIQLNSQNLSALEAVLSNPNSTYEEKLAALLPVYMTLLHETTHYGDYLDGRRQDGGEPGFSFEYDVWLSKTVNIDGEEINVMYFFGDKYNSEEVQQIIEEKGNSQEGQGTFPTIPE